MRQGQQNRRGRGRNNNQGRKGQNPLTRTFESAGPDVKIRGTPAHIAEKYMALARDAQSSGDPVLAENYLQHAEHYNRIIMAFREQVGQGGEMQNGGMMRHRPGGYSDPSMSEDFGEDDGEEIGGEMAGQQPVVRGQEPQPRSFEGQTRFDDRGQRPPYEGSRQPHHHRDRHQGEGRSFQDRHDRQDHRNERFSRPDRFERPAPASAQSEAPAEGAQPVRRGAGEQRSLSHHEQPEFLRRPVRRPRREGNGAPAEEQEAVATPTADEPGHD